MSTILDLQILQTEKVLTLVVGLLEEYIFKPRQNFFRNGGQVQTLRKTIPYDRSSDMKSSFAQFGYCSHHKF